MVKLDSFFETYRSSLQGETSDADMRALSCCSEPVPAEAVQLEYSEAEGAEFVVSSVQPGGQPVLAESRGPLG